MFSHDKPNFRPQRSLTDAIARWLTLSHFAWFLAVALVVMLGVIGVKSAQKIQSSSGSPYTLTAMTGTTLDIALRDMQTRNALVFLFDARCGELCDKQLAALLNLRQMQESGALALFLVALDDTPQDTVRYLESIRWPASMPVHYAAPEERNSIGRTLERLGSGSVRFTYPHTLLFAKPRKLITEYKGYVRSQEISRTLQLHRMPMP